MSVICWLIYRFDESWLDSRLGKESFFFSRASRPVLKSTHFPVQLVHWAISTGVQRPRREADHSSLLPRLRISTSTLPFKCKRGQRLFRRHIVLQCLEWRCERNYRRPSIRLQHWWMCKGRTSRYCVNIKAAKYEVCSESNALHFFSRKECMEFTHSITGYFLYTCYFFT